MKSDYEITEYTSELNVEIPPEEEFKKIAQIFKIYPNEPKEYALANYERGMLLYGLISKYKVELKDIQQCAWLGHCENKIDGKIVSIDPVSLDNTIELLIDGNDEPRTEKTSTKQIWSKYAKFEWLEKIMPMTCFSDELLKKEDLPKFDFGFIDGHHIYEAVLCDFNIFLKNSNKKLHCLFDDYIDDEDTRMKHGVPDRS